MIDYIPIFLDWAETTKELNAQEKGRLIDALVLYARGEDWQDQIKGNEKFVFPFMKGAIDRRREFLDLQKQRGQKGGRPRKEKSQGFETDNEKTQHDEYNYDNDYDYDNDNNNDNDDNGDNECVKKVRFARKHAPMPPTVEDVQDYCNEKGYRIDAQYFVDYYAARGWKLKQGPMKDWQAAVRTWVHNGFSTTSQNGKPDLTQADPRIAALEDLKRKFAEEEGGIT